MLRQLEQQFLLNQLQLKQQQDQIEAALAAMNLPTERQRAGSSQRTQHVSGKLELLLFSKSAVFSLCQALDLRYCIETCALLGTNI